MDKNTPLGRRAMMSGIKTRQDLIDAGAIDDATKKAYRQWIDETMDVLAEPLEKNIAKAAPMETPYGKSFFSYTPEGKLAGVPGKVLRGVGKVAGPVGVALTAAEMGGALTELRKLGAEKIAEKNALKESENTGESVEFKGPYTPEERLRVKEMLKKLRAEAKLR
jgi:hypothetical protein